jgi:Ring finger domain/PA domain
MTIPANNWCADCDAPCYDHATMCTVCGATLGPMPVVDDDASAMLAAREFPTVRLRPFPDSDFARLHDAGREMTELLRGVRASLANMEAAHENLRQTVETAQLAMAALPTRLQDLIRDGGGGAGGGSSQATSTDALELLPRTVLTEHSALFYRCSLTIERPLELPSSLGTTAHQEEPWTIAAIPGEFGQYERNFCLNAVLRLADPLTGHKVGSNPTSAELQHAPLATAPCHDQRPVIYYFVRGGGVSFVRKALVAQAAGAVACVIGNHVPSPWPFSMCDSTNEAAATSLTIPTVMVSQAHGEALHRAIRSAHGAELSCTLRMEPTLCDDTVSSSSSTESCVVCAEVYAAGHTIVTLSGCGHTFHEACALQWLQRHNTCPYCRHSLPLQDEELERRRQQQQNSATDGNNASGTQPDFYG